MDSPDLRNLLPLPQLSTLVTSWLAEDCPSVDPGGYVVGSEPRTARLFQKAPGVLAGVPFADEVFRQCGCHCEWTTPEGKRLPGKEKVLPVCVAVVTGPANKLLLAERVALNILARCSGIATRSQDTLQLLRQNGFTGILAGTRKTTPGFRLVEKYGMLVGGCDAHRMDLSSMTMLKDNHVWSVGSIATAVKRARDVAGFSVKIEVEVQSEEEADEAIGAGADVIMLDNFNAAGAKTAAASLKRRWQEKGKGGAFLIEVSGGLTKDNVADYVTNGKGYPLPTARCRR